MSIIEIFCEGAVIGKHMAVAEVSIPLFPEVAINTVAIPIVSQRKERVMLSDSDEAAFRNVRGMTVTRDEFIARHARGMRPDGISVDFPGGPGGSSEPDSERAKGFIPINDGTGGPDRAQDVDRV